MLAWHYSGPSPVNSERHSIGGLPKRAPAPVRQSLRVEAAQLPTWLALRARPVVAKRHHLRFRNTRNVKSILSFSADNLPKP
jgi:hypothetical protein